MKVEILETEDILIYDLIDDLNANAKRKIEVPIILAGGTYKISLETLQTTAEPYERRGVQANSSSGERRPATELEEMK